MRLSILARLILSYLLLFGIVTGMSLYFIYHLNQFNHITRSIILNDSTIAEYSSQLSDILLTESRYDRKFVILKDDKLFENYLQARNEFDDLLSKALAATKSEEIQQLWKNISEQHQQFNRQVNLEKELIRVAKTYPAERYAERKRIITDSIIQELKQIRTANEKNVLTKIVHLSEQSDKARNFATLISIAALATGLTVAYIITRSIKKPLDKIRAKTLKISQGNFQGDIHVKSPPVIAELAEAINTMCHKLQEVDTIKSDFFSHMSHELRTPLTSIKEGTTLLLEGLGGEISEKQQRILSIVIKECNRLINIVNSLLDLSKMEAGMLKYQFRPTDIATLVKQSLDILGPLAERKNISIDNQITSVSPVNVDHERMQQVFHNIIGNAIKFTPENGSIHITGKTGKRCVELEVKDSGIGIREEDLEKIFLKFQQIIPARGEKTKGTGLGLATVKQIILAHGGKVWAKSQEGQGTTFHIVLPQVA